MNNVGYGIIFYNETKKYITQTRCGIFYINKNGTTEEKLCSIFDSAQMVVDRYGVDQVALEMSYHNKNKARGGFSVRESIGALKVAFTQKGKPMFYYTPQRIKKVVTGYGRSEKIEVAQSILSVLGIEEFSFERKIRNKFVLENMTAKILIQKKFDHVADALSTAYCRLKEIDCLKEGGLKGVVV